jgi:hypothetical protein
LISDIRPGWTINDIKEMSFRERFNWLEIAKEEGKVVTTDGR